MKKIENIKFNFTSDMANDIVVIYNLKQELDRLKNKRKSSKNLKLEEEYNKLKQQLDSVKKQFIENFKKNNQEQITEYKNIKKEQDN